VKREKGKRNQRLKCKNQNCGIPTTLGYFFERSLGSLRSVGMTARREKGEVSIWIPAYCMQGFGKREKVN
jgi:hypothetical protein